jgi:hypothetical protein
MAAQRPAYISPSAQDIVDGLLRVAGVGDGVRDGLVDGHLVREDPGDALLQGTSTVDNVLCARTPQKALMRQYDPTKVLNHPDFKVLSQDEVDEYVKQGDKQVNLACAYNAHKQVHMVRKPASKSAHQIWKNQAHQPDS